MGFLGDDEHPDPSATALHKILDFFLILIGIALIIFSIISIKALGTASFFSIILLCVGIGVILFSVVGMFGSGYYKGGEKEGRLLCLRVFWLATLLFAAILFMFGGICLVSQETIQSYVLVYYGQFTDMTNQFGGQAGAMMQQLTMLLNNFKLLGGVGIGIAVYLLLCFLCSSYLMGTRVFLLTCGMFGSIGVAIIGGVVIALSMYFQNYVEVMKSLSNILFWGLVLGIISIVLGFVGLLSYWLHKKLPILIHLFTFVVVGLAVAYFVVGIVSFSLGGTLGNSQIFSEKIDDLCRPNVEITPVSDKNAKLIVNAENSKCYKIVASAVTFECQRVRNQEMSADICPFEKKKDENSKNPDPPNCICTGSTESYIQDLTSVEDFVKFGYVANKKSVVSNYKILGMIGIVTGIMLAFIALALLMHWCCYPVEKKEEDDDDKYEWVYEDDDSDGEDVNEKNDD